MALVFDFLNGLHDAANSIATVVATRVLRPQTAVVWASPYRRPSRRGSGRDGRHHRPWCHCRHHHGACCLPRMLRGVGRSPGRRTRCSAHWRVTGELVRRAAAEKVTTSTAMNSVSEPPSPNSSSPLEPPVSVSAPSPAMTCTPRRLPTIVASSALSSRKMLVNELSGQLAVCTSTWLQPTPAVTVAFAS